MRRTKVHLQLRLAREASGNLFICYNVGRKSMNKGKALLSGMGDSVRADTGSALLRNMVYQDMRN